MSVAAFGLLNIDLIYAGGSRLPKPGEEIYYPQMDIQLGGGPALLPIVLHHFGIEARLGTFLSEDMASQIARQLLANLQFDGHQNFYRKKNGHPVIVTSAVALRQDRCFISHCGDRAGLRLSPEVVYRFLHGAKVCFALPGYPQVMRRLRKEGTLVVYDFGWEEKMKISDHEEMLRQVDFYTPNDKEAMKLTRTRTPEEAIQSLRRYVQCPIVTLGKEGCLAISGDKITRVRPPTRFKAVDTTGAGDNFLAGVVFGLCKGWGLIDCLKMGNIFGGISTTHLGCYRGIFSVTERDLQRMTPFSIQESRAPLRSRKNNREDSAKALEQLRKYGHDTCHGSSGTIARPPNHPGQPF